MIVFFYIAAFFVFAILQAIFINGISIAMGGTDKLDKNGNLKADGDVLYFIKRELSKGAKHKELLKGDALYKVIKFIEIKYAKTFTDNIVFFGDVPAIEYSLTEDQGNLKGFLETIKLNEGLKYGALEDWLIPENKGDNKGYYVLYAETMKYKYNNWIRKAVGLSCIKCGSSFYGPTTLVPVLIYLFGIRWEIVPVAIFNIGVLIFLNFYFYKALSEIVLKFYHNGIIKSTDQTMSQSIIEGHLTNCYGAVMQSVIDKKKRLGELDDSYLISGAIKSNNVTLERVGNKSVLSLAGLKIMRLDNALQIVGFDNIVDECGCNQGNMPNLETISYVQPTEAKFYQNVGYSNLFYYTLIGEDIVIYNVPDCLKKVVFQYVSDASTIDIPQDVCLQMCKLAFPDVFGVKKFDKTKVDDNSNAAIENLKLQMDAQA